MTPAKRQGGTAAAGAVPDAGSLAALVAMAGVSALWSLFLWGEMLVARAGGRPFCPLSAPDACATLWDGAFASTVHAQSGLPVAGWGLAWSLAAFALALAALMRVAQAKPVPLFVSAIRMTAAGGVLAVFVLAAAAFAEGGFCVGCFVSYVLAGGYAGIALISWQPLGLPERGRGLALTAAALAVGYAMLLYPGARTPRAAAAGGLDFSPGRRSEASAKAAPAQDEALSDLVASLEGDQRQALADALEQYRHGLDLGRPAARFVIGPADAALRITEFTDVRCDHCAQLHHALRQLRAEMPDAFSLEPRQFPLDAECNPGVRQRTDPVRCLAAKAQICLEGSDQFLSYAGALFERQKTLTQDDVYRLAEPYLPRTRLEACVASPSTAAKLADDINVALQYDPPGTPVVLINGRLAPATPAFAYVMILSGGRADHPAFADLPVARSGHSH